MRTRTSGRSGGQGDTMPSPTAPSTGGSPHDHRRPWFQFSLATMFAFVTIAGCCSGVALLGRWIWNGESQVASFRCPQGQVIQVYQPHFMEVSQPIYFRVRQRGKQVAGGGASVSFEDRVTSDKFRLVSSDAGDVVGIFSLFDGGTQVSAWNPTFVHQFSTNATYDGEEAPDGLLRRLFTDFHRRYPGDRTALMGRNWEQTLPGNQTGK